MLEGVKEKLHKYHKWEPLAFFVAGFSFDALLLHRIDNPLMLVHQATYLTLSALIIAWDLFCEEGKGSVPGWMNWLWKYREGILHFMLGTLLNVYTIFYFKSGSFVSSIYFLLILGLLLFANEVRPAQISKHFLRNALFGLCLISYMNILVSIVIGSIGIWVFLIAIAVAGLLHSLFMRFLQSRLERQRLFRDIRVPFMGIAILYTLLYVFKVLPPVPLSVKYIGIYHTVSRESGDYTLGYTRSKWRFWQSGDQTFEARPGDVVHCFAQIFSPTHFHDELRFVWEFKNPKRGWELRDNIQLKIKGGREEGYRFDSQISNYEPGSWRVSLATLDGREVGRIGFEVVPSENPAQAPSFSYELH